MPQISNPKNDRRSLTHTFSEVGSSNGSLLQNQTGQLSPVLKWTCPRKFESIRYAGGRHKTKFVPRYRQDVTGSTGDDTVVSLNGIIQPVTGEEQVDDMPYDPVIAYNITQDIDYTDDLTYDYAANEVTLPSDPADGDSVALWPILTQGTVQYRGLDQFGHEIAPLDEWGVPTHNFHDFNQDKNNSEIHLVGAMEWNENETLAMYVDAPLQIVWEDTDYPRGQYVTTIEQRVDVSV
jgi:hypothetical protein